MTTLCTLFGLLPLALGLGAGAELQRPLALAVIGGLALSTPVTLLLGARPLRRCRRDGANATCRRRVRVDAGRWPGRPSTSPAQKQLTDPFEPCS